MKRPKYIFDLIEKKNIESIKEQLRYTDLTIRNIYGSTILCELIRSNIPEITKLAEMLIDEGEIDINLRNIHYDIIKKQTFTPLMMACHKGNYIIAKKLIDRKANLDLQEELNGWTSLMLAAESLEPEIVKLLIDSGADINIKNYNNETAADYIKKRLEKAKKIVEIDNLLTQLN